MDSVATVTSRIYRHVLDGRPSKALSVAASYQKLPEYRKDLMFCLNCAVAAVRSKSAVLLPTQTPRYYRALARKATGYDSLVEANVWESSAANAIVKGDLPAALKMYQWALELDSGKYRRNSVERQVEKLQQEIKARKKAKQPFITQRKDVATQPRHRQ
jgi:hypothetical protein